MSQTTPSQTAKTTKPTATPMTPNLFHLSGDHLQVTFSTTSISGQPLLTFQAPHHTKSFQGTEIQTVEDTALGTLVTVTMIVKPDVGNTTFTLLIPRIEVNSVGTVVPVRTYGITTVHSIPFLAPGTVQGQMDTYTVTPLHGTAQAVIP